MVAPEPPTADYRGYPQLYGEIFETVQTSGLFEDSKTFVDAIPMTEPAEIRSAYEDVSGRDEQTLGAFVNDYFALPEDVTAGVDQPVGDTMNEHIRNLWKYLTSTADDQVHDWSTLLPLPHPYIKPGGRFREIYYWDTYFTAEGLVRSGMVDMVENLIDNFASLVDQYGFVPNGNRMYYLGRSQPPMFCQLLLVLERDQGTDAVLDYLPSLREEYDFWMDGTDSLGQESPTHRRVVRLPDGSVLNRYWDDYPAPRPEAYKEDIAVAEDHSRDDHERIYRDLRAAAESGWDFSSRWFADLQNIETIHTTDLLPVDLNALLYDVERNLARFCEAAGDVEGADFYRRRRGQRGEAIREYLWDDEREYFFDYDWRAGEHSDAWSLAGTVPLFVDSATDEQAAGVARAIEERFLEPGGIPVTLHETGEQWDYPAGWAPLTWLAVVGLDNYGYRDLAREITERWLDTNRDVFEESGVMMEKYDVASVDVTEGVGEYVRQAGFGWTNGVTLALQDRRASWE
jgi:alpha,alpha-trehalase